MYNIVLYSDYTTTMVLVYRHENIQTADATQMPNTPEASHLYHYPDTPCTAHVMPHVPIQKQKYPTLPAPTKPIPNHHHLSALCGSFLGSSAFLFNGSRNSSGPSKLRFALAVLVEALPVAFAEIVGLSVWVGSI